MCKKQRKTKKKKKKGANRIESVRLQAKVQRGEKHASATLPVYTPGTSWTHKYGTVEWFHRQLKAIRCQKNSRLTEVLSTVLLGIRAVKDDLQTTVAKLMYGETLRLPELQFLSRRTTHRLWRSCEIISTIYVRLKHHGTENDSLSRMWRRQRVFVRGWHCSQLMTDRTRLSIEFCRTYSFGKNMTISIV